MLRQGLVVFCMMVVLCSCYREYRPHPALPQRHETVCLLPSFENDASLPFVWYLDGILRVSVTLPNVGEMLLTSVVDEIHSLGFTTKLGSSDREIVEDPECDYFMGFGIKEPSPAQQEVRPPGGTYKNNETSLYSFSVIQMDLTNVTFVRIKDMQTLAEDEVFFTDPLKIPDYYHRKDPWLTDEFAFYTPLIQIGVHAVVEAYFRDRLHLI